MLTRTQNASQHELTKSLTYQQGKKKYFSLCWSNLSHESKDTKCISTWVDQTHPLQARTQNASQHALNNAYQASEDTKCIAPWVYQSPLMTERIQNVRQHVLIKPLPSPRGQNMQLNMCRRMLSHGCDDTKCNWTCVEQTASQNVLTKPLISMRGHKLNLDMYWPKLIPCHRGLTMYLYIWWTNITFANEYKKCIFNILLPNLSHPSEDKKCNWTWRNPSHDCTVTNISQLVLIKPVP